MSEKQFSKIAGHPDNQKNLKLLNDFGINYIRSPEWTLLLYAVYEGKVELARFLISRGACTNIAKGPSCAFPLLLAAERADTAMIHLLVENGANIRQKSAFDWTALHKLCNSLNLEAIKYLVQKGADISAETAQGDTPLHILSRLPKTHEGVSFMIAKGASMESKNQKGQTALLVASLYGNDVGALVLMNEGARISVLDNQGRTPLGLLIQKRSKKRYKKILETIISKIAVDYFLDPSSIIQNDVDLIKGNEIYNNFFQNCINDLTRMERSMFYPPYSYLSVLKMTNNVFKLATLLKNQEFVENFKIKLNTILFYREELEKILEKGLQLEKKMSTIEERINKIFSKFLPTVILKKIVKNLCIEDSLAN